MLKIPLMPPTLKSIALNTISFELWKQPDVAREINYLFNSYPDFPRGRLREWPKIQKIVVDKIFRLSLPDLLTEKTSDAVIVLGQRIRIWLGKVINVFPKSTVADIIHLICLNSDGGVDMKKTATLILNEVPNLDVDVRYRFACNNCLEDHVHNLWKELPDKRKQKYAHPGGADVDAIVTFWSCGNMAKFGLSKVKNLNVLKKILQRRSPSIPNNINDLCITESLSTSNSVAFKYFWGKLTEEERWENSVRYILYSVYKNITLSEGCSNTELPIEQADGSKEICQCLVSGMNEVQLQELVQRNPYATLHIWFWCKYWQKELILLERILNFISPSAYRKFIDNIIPSPITPSSVSDFFVIRCKTIFKELWRNTPNSIKRGLFENVNGIKYILYTFVLNLDVDILQLIFDDATPEEKKEIVNHPIWPKFIDEVVKYKCHFSITNVAFMKAMHLREDEVGDFLEEVGAACHPTKEVKGDSWVLLEILQKWKKRNENRS